MKEIDSQVVETTEKLRETQVALKSVQSHFESLKITGLEMNPLIGQIYGLAQANVENSVVELFEENLKNAKKNFLEK